VVLENFEASHGLRVERHEVFRSIDCEARQLLCDHLLRFAQVRDESACGSRRERPSFQTQRLKRTHLKMLKQCATRILILERIFTATRSESGQRVAVNFRAIARQKYLRGCDALQLWNRVFRNKLGRCEFPCCYVCVSNSRALPVSDVGCQIVIDLVLQESGFEDCAGRNYSDHATLD
jgi:hypothetical protein